MLESLGLSITIKDVKADKLVKPGWYAVEIMEQKNELAKDKESELFIVEVEGREGDSDGVPVRAMFSEKFTQSLVGYVRATGKAQGLADPVNETRGVDPAYKFPKNKGLVVLGKFETYRGKNGDEKPRNNIADWAPLTPGHVLESKNMALAGGSTAPVGVTGFGS